MNHDPSHQQIASLREAVRARLTMVELCIKDGLEGRREGRGLRARCPFHEEKSGSFAIGQRKDDEAHCFGCSWHGDLFAYWQQRHGLDHREAVNQLASLVGLAPVIEGVQWTRPKAKTLVTVRGDDRIDRGEKPVLPRMRALRPAEIEQLAMLRGLSVESVRLAAQVFRRVAFTQWPLQLDRRDDVFRTSCQTHWLRCKLETKDCAPVPCFASWAVTDDTRWVVQMRRLDGEKYHKKEGDAYKTHTTGTAKWPLGAAEIGDRVNVLLVEGGADMLAAYHFLHYFGRLREVAVVAVLGASVIICDEALKFFRGKRVRIMADADAVQIKEIKLKDGTVKTVETCPGADAAARWQDQLTTAGAAVKTFSLAGLVRADGEPVKDLNDLALCEREVWESDEIRWAFTEWKEGFGG